MGIKRFIFIVGIGTIAYQLYKKRWLYTWMF
jgi:hypothetical protein